MNPISQAASNAQSTAPFVVRTEVEETFRRLTPQPQADISYLSLRDLKVNDPRAATNGKIEFPGPRGGKSEIATRLAVDVIHENSRVLEAGLNLVVVSDAPQPVQDSAGLVATVERPAAFIYSEPAKFAKIMDLSSVADSGLPFNIAETALDFGLSKQLGFEVVLTRRQRKQFLDGAIDDALLASLIRGIGRALDMLFLQTLLQPTGVIQNFSIAAASARGLRIDDLRGIIGKSGTGALWRGDGVFTAQNVPANISDVLDQSVIGDFSRHAIAVFDDITLLARLNGGHPPNPNGDLTVTCMFNAQPLITDGGTSFWLATA